MTITATTSHKPLEATEPRQRQQEPQGVALPMAIEQALIDCCRLGLASSEGTELHDTTDALWFHSGVAFPIYNGIYRPHFADAGDDPQAIAEAMAALLAPFKQTKTPMVVCTGPMSQQQPLHKPLREQGLWKIASIPGMAIDLRDLSEKWLKPSLEIRQVRDEDALRQWVAIQNDCFEFPRWVAGVTFGTMKAAVAAPEGPVKLYLGSYKGIPVATTMTVESLDNVGVFNVACLPEARRRGFGAAITAAPLLRAKGKRHGVLHATPEGLPLYEAMGFETHCHIDNYLYSPISTVLSLTLTSFRRKLAHKLRRSLP